MYSPSDDMEGDFSFIWPARKNPWLIAPNGKDIPLHLDRYIPILPQKGVTNPLRMDTPALPAKPEDPEGNLQPATPPSAEAEAQPVTPPLADAQPAPNNSEVEQS